MDFVWEYDGIVIIFDCMVIKCYKMLILNNVLIFKIEVSGLILGSDNGSLVIFICDSIFDLWDEFKMLFDVILLFLVYVQLSKYSGWVMVFGLLFM